MNKLYTLIAEALECNVNDIFTTKKISDIEEWDSLGQLSVLSALSDATEGKTDTLNLTNLETIKELEDLLEKNNINL